MTSRRRQRFIGEICGFGTASGHRVIVGRWPVSPFGAFADVMHESPGGTRTLFAPSAETAAFIASTYQFDDVVITAVTARRSTGRLVVTAGALEADVAIGPRTAVGRLLRLVPGRLATAPWWCTVTDPIARVTMKGVRTRGTAGNGRTEWYGATDRHWVAGVRCTMDGSDLGPLADVWPPVRFGFSSTPRRPSIVAVTTTVEDGGH